MSPSSSAAVAMLSLPGETRILINSPKVATYDLQPEMSAYELADATVKEIEADKHDVIILNFANPDMVGHCGLLEPTIKAVEATDECLGRVVDADSGERRRCDHYGRSWQCGNGLDDDRPSAYGTYDESCAVYCYDQAW